MTVDDSNRQSGGLDVFVDHLRKVIPDDRMPEVLRCMEADQRCCFRLLPRQDTDRVLGELASAGLKVAAVQGLSGWYQVDEIQREQLTHSAAAEAGRIYIQNPSSLLPVCALMPEPGENVLDLAAAPGGKTLLLAEAMAGQGRIAAVEPVRNRFFRLRANLKRHGVAMVDTYLRDGRGVGRACPEQFDRVLLDAPCSSEARIRFSVPSSYGHWSMRKVREMQRKQKSLLRSALDALRPGGVMVYSTCSFSVEENELVLDSQLRKYPGEAEIEPLPDMQPELLAAHTAWKQKALRDDLGNACRVLPDLTWDGFFLARIRKFS